MFLVTSYMLQVLGELCSLPRAHLHFLLTRQTCLGFVGQLLHWEADLIAQWETGSQQAVTRQPLARCCSPLASYTGILYSCALLLTALGFLKQSPPFVSMTLRSVFILHLRPSSRIVRDHLPWSASPQVLQAGHGWRSRSKVMLGRQTCRLLTAKVLEAVSFLAVLYITI